MIFLYVLLFDFHSWHRKQQELQFSSSIVYLHLSHKQLCLQGYLQRCVICIICIISGTNRHGSEWNLVFTCNCETLTMSTWLWLEGIQLRLENNNKVNLLPITFCFINVYSTPTPTLTLPPYNNANTVNIFAQRDKMRQYSDETLNRGPDSLWSLKIPWHFS